MDEKPEAVRLEHARGQVEFDGVTFRYGTSDRAALKDVSFKIEPGQLAALVGPTGAGKTTITNLLPRFYDPQLGAVRMDGYDVRDLSLESLGRQIGMVFQDTFLFHPRYRHHPGDGPRWGRRARQPCRQAQAGWTVRASL